MQVHFNPEINLGTIVEISVFIVSIAGAILKLGKLETKLNIMFDWFQSTVIRRNGPDQKDIERFHGEGR